VRLLGVRSEAMKHRTIAHYVTVGAVGIIIVAAFYSGYDWVLYPLCVGLFAAGYIAGWHDAAAGFLDGVERVKRRL
jgi:hypothetical protein